MATKAALKSNKWTQIPEGRKGKGYKLELIKSKSANAKATGKSKAIRKIIARIHTFNAQEGGLETK